MNINTLPRNKYEIDESIRIRISHVLGIKNYSLCLRKCEHVSNYVFYEKWTSIQMIEDGLLLKWFKKYIIEDRIRMINTFPESIRPHKFSTKKDKVYDFLETEFVASNLEYYLDDNESTYNILVVGPTGSGKSRFINVLFNQDLCSSNKSLVSVTKEISIYIIINF